MPLPLMAPQCALIALISQGPSEVAELFGLALFLVDLVRCNPKDW